MQSKPAGHPDTVFATTLYVAIALFFGIWLVWDATFFRLVTYSLWADYWEHSALLTEWLRDFANPANPHVADDSLSPRYMPWFWLLTLLGVSFGLTSVELMSISAVCSYVLILFGLHLFLKAYFRDPWAPLIGFFAIFMFWGVGWNWSNLYQIKSFFYVAGYPSSLVFGLSLIAFWATLRTLRGDEKLLSGFFVLFLLSALMFLCHPLTGVFGIVGCGLLTLTEETSWQRRSGLWLGLALGLVFAEAWPYFSVWKVALGLYGSGFEKWGASDSSTGMLERFESGAWKHIFYNPRLVLIILGPALLGIPVCLWLLVRGRCLFIVAGAAVMSVPYLAHLFVEVPLAHRFLLFVVVFLQFALVWLILQVIANWRTAPRSLFDSVAMWSTILVLLAVAAFNVALLRMEFRGQTLSTKTLQIMDKHGQIPGRTSVVELYEKLTQPLPADAVVFTTARVGWPLPTVKGKVVSLYHENPMLLDQADRAAATGAFFYNSMDDQERATLVRRYQANYLLIDAADSDMDDGVGSWLQRYAALVAEVGSYQMYGIDLASLPESKQEVADAEVIAVEDVRAESGGAGRAGNADLAAEPENARPMVEPEAEDQPAASFGAPISEPLFDPERNGG